MDRAVLLSIHIVEDIAQTCRDVAALARGQILFRGSGNGVGRSGGFGDAAAA